MDMVYVCTDLGHVLLKQLFFCIAWLMGAFLKGDEAGFASSLFIIRMFCEHEHMLLAGAGYGPASDK